MRLRATALRVTLFAALCFCLLAPLAAHAQSRVYAKDLVGSFDLDLNLDDVDVSEAENAIERMALRAVHALFEELTIRFTFDEDGSVEVVSQAFDEEPEADTATWRINAKGQLVMGEMDGVSINGVGDGETVWMWDDGRLQAYEYDDDGRLERSGVSLRPVERN